MQLQGWRVCIVEKRLAEGRLQEWNSTRKELQVGLPYVPLTCCSQHLHA